MLSNYILDSKLEINCFNIFRKDRTDNKRRSNSVPILIIIAIYLNFIYKSFDTELF